MTKLNLEEIEKYRNLRISERNLPKNSVKNLTDQLEIIEEFIEKKWGYGLPYYLASDYHMENKGLMSISNSLSRLAEKHDQNFSISAHTVQKLFEYFDIPTRTMKETKINQQNFKFGRNRYS